MDEELKYFLKEGPHTTKELARLTGKSDSGIRKTLAKHTDTLRCKKNEAGTNLFWIEPSNGDTVEMPEDGQGARSQANPVQTPSSGPEGPEIGPKAKTRGRPAKFSGMKLFPSESLLSTKANPEGDIDPEVSLYANPRRVGSHGYNSMQVIINAPGITTEDFVKAGGRLNDLRWDIDKDNVRAEQE